MSRIEISNLNVAQSFLTEISATDTTKIIGGSNSKEGKKGKKYDDDCGKGRGHGGHGGYCDGGYGHGGYGHGYDCD